MEISRRFFLKGIGGLVAIAAGIDKLNLIFPTDPLVHPTANGHFRAIAAYDLVSDRFVIRYDVGDGTTQLNIQTPIYTKISAEDFYQQIHLPFEAALNEEIKRRKIKRLIELPYPPSYEHPDWFMKVSREIPQLRLT